MSGFKAGVRSNWARSLTLEQRQTVKEIRRSHNAGGLKGHNGSEGWRVYMMPTTGPAKYVELRHYMTEGRIARWVVERDGSVSADNDRGMRSEFQEVAA